jgi:NTP pyrophosphatase (non-canonical NTP hydrolase)
MDFDHYEKKAMQFAVYMSSVYPALGLAGEAGEFLGKLSKIARVNDADSFPNIWQCLDSPQRDNLIDELGDVLWMVAACADELDVTLDEVASRNLAKLTDRADRGVICGTGDNR